MARKRYSPEEIITKLREADVALAEGASVNDVVRRLGVQKVTYYRWRKEYGGMRVDQAKRLKELEPWCSADDVTLGELEKVCEGASVAGKPANWAYKR